MRRYEIKKEQPKERKFTDNQKFLSYSLEAPSKQLNFMPNTYPGLPSYYQTPYEDYLKCFKRQDETLEIQDLINQNEQRHEISKFQLSFPQQQSIRKFEGNAISSTVARQYFKNKHRPNYAPQLEGRDQQHHNGGTIEFNESGREHFEYIQYERGS